MKVHEINVGVASKSIWILNFWDALLLAKFPNPPGRPSTLIKASSRFRALQQMHPHTEPPIETGAQSSTDRKASFLIHPHAGKSLCLLESNWYTFNAQTITDCPPFGRLCLPTKNRNTNGTLKVYRKIAIKKRATIQMQS